MGNSLLERGKNAESGRYFQKALGINPDGLEANCGLIRTLMASKKYDRARMILRPLILECPENLWYNFYMGEILEATGKLTGARYYFNKAFLYSENEKQRYAAQWHLTYLKTSMEYSRNCQQNSAFIKGISASNTPAKCHHLTKVAMFTAITGIHSDKSIDDIRLASALLENGCFLLLRPACLDSALAQQDLDLGFTLDESTAFEIGQGLGVDMAILPDIGSSGWQDGILLRVLNIRDSSIIAQIRGSITVRDDTYEISNELAALLIDALITAK